MTAASGVCHFTISGAWLTEHVRERMLSDMEDSALALLVDHLDGMTYEIALAILRGQKRLIGVTGEGEGIELADEEPEVSHAWAETLTGRYGNRCELRCPDGSSRRGWFRPVAYITDFGPMDVSDSRVPVRNTRAGRVNFVRWGAQRLWHYAYEDEIALSPLENFGRYPAVARDELVGGPSGPPMEGPGGGLGFIFAPCSTVPGWLREIAAKTPTEALRAHLRDGGALEARGHSIWYPDEAARQSQTLQGMLAAAEEQTARDPRNPPTMRVEATRAAVNLRAAEAKRKAEEALRKAYADEDRQVRTRGALLATYAAQVREAAGPIDGPGWFTMTIMPDCPAEFTVRVPLAPFQCWSLWRTAGQHLMPKYTPVCPSGLRLYGDDPYHSDWMLGAFPDRDVDHAYRDEEIRAASYRAKAEVQHELLGFTAAVLSGRGRVTGRVVHPEPGAEVPPGSIAVLPNARPEYESVVRSAAATIVPTGGELCHLAVVAGEVGRIILRVEDCLARYPVGAELTVDANEGRVDISEEDVHGPFGYLSRRRQELEP